MIYIAGVVADGWPTNVSVKQDPAGNLKPDKAKSTGRIDGVVAMIMGLGRAMVRSEYGGFVTVWVMGDETSGVEYP